MKLIWHETFSSYSASELFNLILDVDAYQEFVPFVKKSMILQKTVEKTKFSQLFHADLVFNFLTYRSYVIGTQDGPYTYKILIKPLSKISFEAQWNIHEAEKNTHLSFEMKSRALIFLKPLLVDTVPKIAQAFIQRAKILNTQKRL